MFNFIFDGKIGDILAPVVPSNKLFLAIQHHKNDEVCQLMMNNDVQRNADGGYGAVHVACRYNNRVALEAILSRGVTVDAIDQSGNSPLHYASKYGNIDICRFLIEQGASPCRKNSRNETPYDVAGEHHVVRQYLLPLQFQAERSASDGRPDASSQLGISTDAYYNNTPSYQYAAHQQQAPSYGAPPQVYGGPIPVAPGNTNTGDISPSNPAPPVWTPAGATANSAAGAGAPPAAPQYNNAPRPAAATTTRIIRPDGFHSSASDPALQKKYGHIQQTSNIAPPPTSFPAPGATGGPAPPPGAYGAPSGPPVGAMPSAGPPAAAVGSNPYANGGVFNRYVAYDAHTNGAAPSYPTTPAPAAAVQSSFPSFPSMNRPGSLPTHAPAAASTSRQYNASTPPSAVPVPAPAPMYPGGTNKIVGAGSPATATGGCGPAGPAAGTSSAGSSAPSSQRLLGNKGLAVSGDDLLGSTSGDGAEVVITASANSSAVL